MENGLGIHANMKKYALILCLLLTALVTAHVTYTDIDPNSTAEMDLGNSAKRFRRLWLSDYLTTTSITSVLVSITDDLYVADDIEVGDNITIAGHASTLLLSVTDDLGIGDDLTVADHASSLLLSITDDLSVGDDVAITDNLFAQDGVFSEDLTALSITSTLLSVTDDASIGDDLGVTGHINGIKFKVTALNGGGLVCASNPGLASNYTTIVGSGAGEDITGADSHCSFFGYKSGEETSGGSSNAFFGSQSGMENIGGDTNTYIGCYAGQNGTTGSSNVALGYSAGLAGGGTGCVFLGRSAGLYETTSNILMIDNESGGDEGGSRTHALIYGKFENHADGPTVTINGTLSVTDNTTLTTLSVTGDLGVGGTLSVTENIKTSALTVGDGFVEVDGGLDTPNHINILVGPDDDEGKTNGITFWESNYSEDNGAEERSARGAMFGYYGDDDGATSPAANYLAMYFTPTWDVAQEQFRFQANGDFYFGYGSGNPTIYFGATGDYIDSTGMEVIDGFDIKSSYLELGQAASPTYAQYYVNSGVNGSFTYTGATQLYDYAAGNFTTTGSYTGSTLTDGAFSTTSGAVTGIASLDGGGTIDLEDNLDGTGFTITGEQLTSTDDITMAGKLTNVMAADDFYGITNDGTTNDYTGSLDTGLYVHNFLRDIGGSGNDSSYTINDGAFGIDFSYNTTNPGVGTGVLRGLFGSVTTSGAFSKANPLGSFNRLSQGANFSTSQTGTYTTNRNLTILDYGFYGDSINNATYTITAGTSKGSFYGVYGKTSAAPTLSSGAITFDYYGGYFNGVGSAAGTSYAVGVFGTASGADTNYAAYFGDGTLVSLGNSATIETDGTVVFNGNATVWEDIRIIPGSFDRPGVADPAYVAYDVNGGGVSTYLTEWAKNDLASFTVQIPHTYLEASNVYVHLHWTPGANGAGENGATVGWKIKHSWANIDGNFPTMSTVDLSDACDGTSHKHQMTPDVSISGAGKTISSILMCNIVRTDTGADDTWSGSGAGNLPMLLEVDFHFEKDTVGSRTITTK